MLDTARLPAFVAAALLFAVFPGPAVFYVVTRSVTQGRPAGLVSVLGIQTGTLVHVAAATLGLSALLAASATAYATLKYLGAAYLVYLGLRALLDRDRPAAPPSIRRRTLRHLYLHGALVAALNPKTALFFLAFLPQFVDAGRGMIPLQVGLLGLLLVAITATSDSCYALLSSRAGALLRASPRLLRRQRLVSGGVYLTLGLTAALSGAKSTGK